MNIGPRSTFLVILANDEQVDKILTLKVTGKLRTSLSVKNELPKGFSKAKSLENLIQFFEQRNHDDNGK